VGLEATVYGATRTLHSGHYGNWAPNPALLLAHLLTSLRDPDGRILVAGYYDDVRPPSEAERRALAAVPDPDAELRRELGIAASEAGGARLVERLLLPALNVDGLLAGGVGAAATNALPSEARAAIDLRLVPDQTPERVRRLVEQHLAAQGWHVLHSDPDLPTRLAHPRLVKLEWKGGYPAARTPLDAPAAAALAAVVEETTGGELIRMPTLGGSIPMHLFQDVLRVPVVGLPIVNHDNNQHAADENLRLQNLWDGIEIFAAVLARLGETWR
jgi:acetylornithine deacetylase/succinyl-diaminopimelate desuccinylase-like protein